MFPFENLEKDVCLREFISQYKRNKLIFPTNFNTSQSYDHSLLLHIASFHDIPADLPDAQAYIRYRCTYYNKELKTFLGRTYISQLVPVEKGFVINKHKDSILLTYANPANLHLTIELSLTYISKAGTTDEVGIGYTILDVSKPEVGKKTMQLYGGSPNFLLTKDQASNYIT
jgi:hypothetical protein